MTETAVVSRAPCVIAHDVTFRMQLVTFKGQPVTGETSYGSNLDDGDRKLFDALPTVVAGWFYRHHDGVESARLEMCQPEFGGDEVDSDATFYEITISASNELPRLRAEAKDERPISVQQLIEEVVPAAIRVYADFGVEMVLSRVEFRKKYESSERGNYKFS
jgi:hypothetical protein